MSNNNTRKSGDLAGEPTSASTNKPDQQPDTQATRVSSLPPTSPQPTPPTFQWPIAQPTVSSQPQWQLLLGRLVLLQFRSIMRRRRISAHCHCWPCWGYWLLLALFWGCCSGSELLAVRMGRLSMLLISPSTSMESIIVGLPSPRKQLSSIPLLELVHPHPHLGHLVQLVALVALVYLVALSQLPQ